MTEARLFSRHSIGTRIAALFMLLILVITAAMTYVSISVSTNELLDSSTEYTEQLIRRVNAELEYVRGVHEGYFRFYCRQRRGRGLSARGPTSTG